MNSANFEDFDVLPLPKVALENRSQLPKSSGVYFVLLESQEVVYIGISSCIYKRWLKHNRLVQAQGFVGAQIAYLLMDEALLRQTERVLVHQFLPAWNCETASILAERAIAVADSCRPIGMVNWNLKPILDERKITRYALSKRSGLAMGTIYAMYDNRGKQVGLETLNSVLEALRDLTGEQIGVEDLLRYTSKA